jgi:hypothetical protein
MVTLNPGSPVDNWLRQIGFAVRKPQAVHPTTCSNDQGWRTAPWRVNRRLLMKEEKKETRQEVNIQLWSASGIFGAA